MRGLALEVGGLGQKEGAYSRICRAAGTAQEMQGPVEWLALFPAPLLIGK